IGTTEWLTWAQTTASTAHIAVVLVSEASIKSESVVQEIAFLRPRLDRRDIDVFPILLSKSIQFHPHLSSVQSKSLLESDHPLKWIRTQLIPSIDSRTLMRGGQSALLSGWRALSNRLGSRSAVRRQLRREKLFQ